MHLIREKTDGIRRRRARFRLVCPVYPAFNVYSGAARIMTALGPVCVATAVQDMPGWDAEVIDENNYRRGPKDPAGLADHAVLQRVRPADIVGLYGGLTSTIPRLFEIARVYRSLGVRTIAGGHHFVGDNIEDALRSGVDIVVIGEGEETIAELLEVIEADGDLSGVRGIAFLKDGRVVHTPARDPLTDFESLPIPDYSVLRYARLKLFGVSGVRGCGMNCEFCAVKGRPRRASPHRVLEQFATACEKYDARMFFIVDDLFAQDRPWALKLCRLLGDYRRRTGARFTVTVQIRLDKARDTELLEAMRDAGVVCLAIGYESPIAEELQAMNKRLKPSDMIALTRLYRRAGFRVHGMFIFGYPMGPAQSFHMPAGQRVRHFRKFIRKARIDTVQVLLPIPLPGTELTERLRQANRIYSTQHVGLEYYDGNFPIIQPDAPLTPEDMQAAAQRIMGRFYRPRSMLSVALSILSFPWMALWMHEIGDSYRRWSQRWWTRLYRTGGWILLRRWAAAFRKDGFLSKLTRAKEGANCNTTSPSR